MHRAWRVLALVIPAIFLVPGSAAACPVCFGAVDSPLVDGMTMAVLALLGITAAVLAGFAAFFLRLVKLARQTGDVQPGRYAREGGQP